jgi:hypothetical protein
MAQDWWTPGGDVTDSTVEVCGHTRRNLVDYFGAEKNIRMITTKDADDRAAWLNTDQNLAEDTIRKRSQFAKQFFSVAVKRKLIPEVLPFLQAAWEAAPEGAVWVFPSIRSGKKNLRSGE